MRLRVLLDAYSNKVRIGAEKSANREKNIVRKRDILLPKIKCEKETFCYLKLSANKRKYSPIKHFLRPFSSYQAINFGAKSLK